MNKKKYCLIASTLRLTSLLIILFAAVSCSKDEKSEPTPRPAPQPYPGETYITDSTYMADKHMKVYNFVYSSLDPYGRDIMLSGTITLGDEVSRQAPARGLLLYNHFTAYRADQCPSHGDLDMQSKVVGSGLIAISADYYGFGVTEQYHQAYCMALCNARASIHALLAAKYLLYQMGYSWDDNLFNVGYSQGGQTAMGVVLLAAMEYHDLNITYTFAGAGSYDLQETYRQFVKATIAGMPSTVISVMLSYNEFMNLGIAYEDMFKEPVLSHINDWIFSKRYTREEIDALVGSLAIADYVTPTMLDTTSTLSMRMMEALDFDHLCKGWHPRGNEHIMLFHSTQDITVPVANTQMMYAFLTANGVQDVDLQIHDIAGTETTPAHENAATMFGLLTILKISQILGIDPWILF